MAGHDFSVLPHRYAVVRLPADAAIPGHLIDSDPIVSITRTGDELSIVCREAHAPAGATATGGWRVLKLHGPFAFDEVGILLSFASPLAAAGISVLTIATYDTDYLLIDTHQLDQAVSVLTSAGHHLRT